MIDKVLWIPMVWGVCHAVSLAGLTGGCVALIHVLKWEIMGATFFMAMYWDFANPSHSLSA